VSTKKGPTGARGPRGPAGPRGPTGPTGARGATGPVGRLGPNANPKELIKALDTQVEGIYRELSLQMQRLTRLQSQLHEVRAAIRRLGGLPSD
jgi:hypothetical protein